ncbi:MAG: CFI-box-CTERM domain-containing protein [Syntrophales bacterium]|nr:CFI-box-CTERM domain-containing protein [Syntrophales bacterium]
MKVPRLRFLMVIPVIIFCMLSFTDSVLYAGDIVLTGNDVMTVENTTYTQTGNIYVKDNAKLTIRDATLIVNIRYHEEFDIIVSDNAVLEIINSTVKTSIDGEIQRIILRGTSNLTFHGSNLSEGLAYFSFGAEGGGNFSGVATLSNSNIDNISLLFTPQSPCTINVSDSVCENITLRFGDNYKGGFADLKPGLFPSWTYTQNNYNILFKNTQIDRFVAACDGACQIVMRNSEFHQFAPTSPSAAIQMTAIDSKINQIPLHGLTNIQASFWGLKTGHYDNWLLSDHSTVTKGELPILNLQNTEITDWWVVSAFGNSEIMIDDSIFEFRVYFNNSFTKITNSSIISRFMLYGATNSTVEFDNTTIENIDVYVPPISVTIKGNLTFSTSAKLLNWYTPSTVTRTYPVTIMGDVGSNPPIASLSLYDKAGTLVWSGQTDARGKANFDIAFTDSNYSDTWNLETSFQGKKETKAIKLLTSTPIALDVTPTPEPTPEPTPQSSSGGGGGGGGCFIATAAWGSYLDPHVQVLRAFRDNCLMTHRPGRAFVDYYYSMSPPIAGYIKQRESLRTATRFILTPIVYSLEYPWLVLIFSGVVICMWGRKKRNIWKVRVEQ